MNSSDIISGPQYPVETTDLPKQLIILLHGFGSDGNDLIQLAKVWSQFMPEALFLAPNAPEVCTTSPSGYQWFSLAALSKAEIDAGVIRASATLNSFIDINLRKYQRKEDRLVLVGFSQGTMMALQVGLRRPQSCAGIIGFSGQLPNAEKLKTEVKKTTPVLLVHGANDEIIPVKALFNAVSELGAIGINVQWHVSTDHGHSIGKDGLELAEEFLRDIFF